MLRSTGTDLGVRGPVPFDFESRAGYVRDTWTVWVGERGGLPVGWSRRCGVMAVREVLRGDGV